MAVFGLSLPELTKEAPNIMLDVGLDLSRRRLDYDTLRDGDEVRRFFEGLSVAPSPEPTDGQ